MIGILHKITTKTFKILEFTEVVVYRERKLAKIEK